MAPQFFLWMIIAAVSVDGASNKLLKPLAETKQSKNADDEKDDLKSASSSYSHQYTDWRGRYPSGYEYSVTGHGTIEDRSSANYGDIGRYNNVDYGGNPGYSTGYGIYKGGYGQSGYDSVGGYNSVNNGYGGGGYGVNQVGSGGYSGSGSGGYGGYSGYGVNAGNNGYGGNPGYGGSTGFGVNQVGGYSGSSGYGGNGGYGGYGGNGGLPSYYGYNNPNYQANNHLGYGYYNKKPGYGNIYNSGITPSLVTGYRGYSR